MPKLAPILTAREVLAITGEGKHAVGGAQGLYLQVLPTGGRTWILRIKTGFASNGNLHRSEIGLGGYPTVSLAQAREKANLARAQISQGHDPVAEKRTSRRAERANLGSVMTFETAAKAFIGAKSPEWRSAVHQKQWHSTLQTYAFPVIGALSVKDIETHHIKEILDPIWITKNETATR
ncbi:MAG TPA: Arm DNA-binding domain-containing protein, partial [Fibrobacteria bacterium]|nr:Arm DNA-binding domain-containing protein [Fibrobacteria bacterium]